MSTQITTAPVTIQAAPVRIQASPTVQAPPVVREYRIQPVGGGRLARLLASLRGGRPAERQWHWQQVGTERGRVEELHSQAAMLLAAR